MTEAEINKIMDIVGQIDILDPNCEKERKILLRTNKQLKALLIKLKQVRQNKGG